MSAQLLKPKELAQRWDVELPYVWRLTREGKLDQLIVDLGPRTKRFRVEAVEEFERNGGLGE